MIAGSTGQFTDANVRNFTPAASCYRRDVPCSCSAPSRQRFGARHAFGLVSPPVGALAFKNRSLRLLKGKKFGVTPDMLVALIFREVEPMQIFCDLPEFGLHRVVIDFDAVDMRPRRQRHSLEARRLRHGVTMRIQSRAIRRCGELLKEFDGRGGDHTKSGGAPTFAPSQREVAEDAGMSKDQQVTAVRVANVPEQAFEQAVESETPPTVTKLADWGRKPSAKPEWFQEMEKAEPKPGWRSFVRLSGLTRQMAELCRDSEPIIVADAVEQHERRELRSNIAQVRRWLKQIAPHLRSSTDGL